MKFQTIQAFENQLKSPLPARSYLLAIPTPFERLSLLKRLIKFLSKGNSFHEVRVDLAEKPAEKALDALTPSLFRETTLIILENIDKIGKGEKILEKIALWMGDVPPATFLLLTSSGGALTTSLYEKAKSHLLYLDLTAEKPWEKKRRLTESVQKRVSDIGRQIEPPALHELLENTSDDPALLASELEKLLLYTEGSGKILITDLRAICKPSPEKSGWEIADALIWQETAPTKLEFSGDLSDLLALIGQCRYHLHLGFALSARPGQSLSAAAALFPHIKPHQVEKYYGAAVARGTAYFRSALMKLFEIDLLAKSTSVKPAVLFEKMVCHLLEGKKNALSLT